MSRWKQLPDSLDPRVRQLVVQMRRIKDHSGLGLQTLAARTGYSRASWDRYLNGRSLPPQEAVAALARVCDTDPARLLALHEVAVAAGRGGAGGAGRVGEAAPGVESGPRDEEPAGLGEENGVRGHGPGRRLLVTVLAGVVLLSVLIALLVAAPWDGARERTGGRPVSADSTERAPGSSGAGVAKKAFAFRAGNDYPCRVHRGEDGLLYAGYSTTRVDLIGMGSSQWAVVEVQCLLRHHGFSPGIADGAFGSRTGRAVERLQAGAHIRVDGVVGEDTWGVLRK
ncbi:helix-turn-helix domain-containing protein [Streptomyces sp. NPDC052107]|uniref:helix-turn-helix domain-containing protein n=1 Tax=Streptomyces sp. NPDC052107 TaxID=3155632 RepID=UPI003441E266